MEHVSLNIEHAINFVGEEKILSLKEKIHSHIGSLYNKTGAGSDYLGWVSLPAEIQTEHLKKITEAADSLRSKAEIVVVVGIGGSYLGSRAVLEALSHTFAHLKTGGSNPLVIFAGHNIGEDYLTELLDILDSRKYGIVVISKSGTTTEPAIAFRILKNHLESLISRDKAKELIVAVTDSRKGALRTLADNEGYRTFDIPDDIGGRYSVLTPVGLLPLAIGGVNIESLVEGARSMQKNTGPEVPFENNPAALYAATRYMLYKSGNKIEILANFDGKLHYLAEWWKQLYGESEGKEGRGIFPASVDLTTDLHSMGQYIQEGQRILMETVISVEKPEHTLRIPHDKENLDSLNFLAGKRIDEVNKMAALGTMMAHVDGGVPNISVTIPRISEYYLGELIYFFEMACGISGYLLEVNPFNQPGVEAYKKNMFALLEKPGYEEETKKIKSRLKAGNI